MGGDELKWYMAIPWTASQTNNQPNQPTKPTKPTKPNQTNQTDQPLSLSGWAHLITESQVWDRAIQVRDLQTYTAMVAIGFKNLTAQGPKCWDESLT